MSESSSTGLGFTSALQIVFITLKLIGFINWSWWWVLSPTWISIVAILVVALVAAIIVFIDKV